MVSAKYLKYRNVYLVIISIRILIVAVDMKGLLRQTTKYIKCKIKFRQRIIIYTFTQPCTNYVSNTTEIWVFDIICNKYRSIIYEYVVQL